MASKRSFSEEKSYIEKLSDCKYRIKPGFVSNMNVDGVFYVNDHLKDLMYEELEEFSTSGGHGGFIPAVKQIANVASLPGIVGHSLGMPDIHSGYGFAIGNVAAFDMADPKAIVSPGGVGFDINCLGAGTKVSLADGTSRPIEEVLVGDEVLSLDESGHGLVPAKVTAQLDRGTKECIEIVFLDGRTLTCTRDHLLRSADGDWVTAGDAAMGTKIAAGVEHPAMEDADAEHTETNSASALPLFPLPIVAKRSVGLKRVYDLSVSEKTPSFTAAGVVVHNCGVRLLRTNLFYKDVVEVKEQLAQTLFDHIPVGVGSEGVIPTTLRDLEEALEMGVDWSLREGYAWAEDKEHAEEYGRMLSADGSKVSMRAKKRGLPQLGTLGAGNHYAEIQVVDEIFDRPAARKMGLEEPGQICVLIHSGSRGLGHQVATDALVQMEKAMSQDKIHLNDRQLACARVQSKEGQEYLRAMAAAANYAWVNRQSMTFLVRQAFAKMFSSTPDDLDMHVVYDVSHNIAKQEEHLVDGRLRTLLVHRKGATRAFPPHHPLVPVDYQFTGQPVLVGGTMGTYSYVLTGTERGMAETFGSTCLPDADHQVLTNKGFLGLAELEAMWGDASPDGPPADPALLVAGFDAASSSLVYERPLRLVVNAARTNQPMVEFTHKPYAPMWASNDSHGTAVGSDERCNHVSLITTPDHDMYVRTTTADHRSGELCFATGKTTFGKLRATELCGNGAPRDIQVLSNAAGGVQQPPDSSADNVMPFDIGGSMGLTTQEQVDTFMELTGYWLGNGTLVEFAKGKPQAMRFIVVKEHDRDWLEHAFAVLKLPWTCVVWDRVDTKRFCTVDIRTSEYLSIFGEYKCAVFLREYAAPRADSEEIKWVAHWMWGRSRNEIRALIGGMHRAEGAEAQGDNVIRTSSARFRDELVRLCLHAGYSAFFVGSGTPVTSWAVHYNLEPFTQPALHTATDVTATTHTGRTWCLTMPSGFIVARRATTDPASGYATRASRSLIIGNCHGAGRALSRNASRRSLTYQEVLKNLADKGISIRVASPKLVTEEAPESYKDVTAVVETCHAAGISRLAVRTRPIAVIKG